MKKINKQRDISERYSQPFRSVSRIIARLPKKGVLRRIKRSKAEKIWFRNFCKPLSMFCFLPDVMLIGASKCGTSSVANHLSSHPDCMPPFYKEVRYFDSSRVTDLDSYKAYFPTFFRRKLKKFLSGRRPWTADFSPTYYDYPHAPRRIFETLGPDIKLILMVRNPIDRAYSQYRFQRELGHEHEETFEKALELEESRIAGEEEKQLQDELYFSRPRNHFGYLARSLYLPYIKNWYQYFDKSQLLIIRFEDFTKSPQSIFDEICDFIAVPRHQISNKVHNASKIEETMATETRAKLVEYFRKHNKEMSGYLGRDFDWDY